MTDEIEEKKEYVDFRERLLKGVDLWQKHFLEEFYKPTTKTIKLHVLSVDHSKDIIKKCGILVFKLLTVVLAANGAIGLKATDDLLNKCGLIEASNENYDAMDMTQELDELDNTEDN